MSNEAEELVYKLSKVDEEMWAIGPLGVFKMRCVIARAALHEAYLKGRREAIELSDQLGYERNVKKFVGDVLKK